MIVTPPRTTQLAYVVILAGAVLSGGMVMGLLLVGLVGAVQTSTGDLDGAAGGPGVLGVLFLAGALALSAVGVWVALRIRSGHVAGLVGGTVVSALGLAQQIGEAATSERFRPGVVVWSVLQAAVLAALVSPSNRSYVRAMTALRTAAVTAPLPPGSPPAP